MEVNGKEIAQRVDVPARQYCDTCRFSNIVMASATAQPLTMICKRNPPQVCGGVMPTQNGPQIASQTLWPIITKDEWCGQHEPDPRGARPRHVVPAQESVIQPA